MEFQKNQCDWVIGRFPNMREYKSKIAGILSSTRKVQESKYSNYIEVTGYIKGYVKYIYKIPSNDGRFQQLIARIQVDPGYSGLLETNYKYRAHLVKDRLSGIETEEVYNG